MTDRPMKPAILKGLRNRCPNCGEGNIMPRYLKIVPECPHCKTELGRARADDGPAYLTILVVAKLLVPPMAWVYTDYDPNAFWVTLGFCTVALLMSLFLLPRFKGMMVGIQWANRMYGL